MSLGRTLQAGMDAVRRMVPRFLSIARELGLEIVGFVFFAFGMVFVFGPFGFIQAYRLDPENPERMTRLLVSGVGAVMFGWFGFDSFRRAKRLARRR